MRTLLAVMVSIAALAAAPASTHEPVSAEGVVAWNAQALSTVRAERATDSQAARIYAMVNVAIFDAVNPLRSDPGQLRTAALVPRDGAPNLADPRAAAVAAAHAVLVGLFPGRASQYDAQLSLDLAIREADTDGNPLTTPDAAWSPRGGGMGGNPEHWSGHSSFSAAAAAVLRGFFCEDAIRFRLTTDSAPGGLAREYPSFSAAATEAGISRVVGGVHFPFSNQAGLDAGRAVGAEVLRRALLLEHGPTHVGECPR